MKPALQLRLHQQLTLTPQLKQAIRLLQLSSIELETELREALESNPLLELPEPGNGHERTTTEPSANHDAEAPAPEVAEPSEAAGADERPFDDEFAGEFSGASLATGDDDDGQHELQGQTTEDLHDHLLWQLNLTTMSSRDRSIALALIDAINDDGYLGEELASIQEGLLPQYHVDHAEIEAVLHRLQHFDPLGVASRNLRECLSVQLGALDAATPGLGLATLLVGEHLEALAKNERVRLSQRMQVSPEELDIAIRLIRSLDPKPGSQIAPLATEYVSPDAYAVRHNGRWRVVLNPGCQPRLAISKHYTSLIARASRDDAGYLRGHLQEARWLIKSLKTRAETIFKVASCIVHQQSAFLDYGPEAMRPMVLKDVAEEIGMHESTVSRVTTRKYLHTPRGTFEFKYFFSSSVATTDGGTASSTAIQAMLRKLIEDEGSDKPFSDSALAAELNRRGIAVARRTVAKYREAMNIPSSNDRSRLS